MFFSAAIFSAFFYALGGAFLSHFARKIDPIFLAAARGFFLIFLMAPLLFFAEKKEFFAILKFAPEIFAVGIFAAAAFAIGLSAARFLPIGVSSAIRSAARVILIFIFSFLFFGEKISAPQIFGTILILFCGGFLSIGEFDFAHLKSGKWRGVFLSIFSAVGAVIFWILGAKISREISPFVAAYFLEFGVGVGGIFLFFAREIWRKFFICGNLNCENLDFQKISRREIWQIFLISATTLGGTGGFFYATKLGPVGVVAAVGAAGILFSAIFGAAFFREKLEFKNWVQIAGIVVGVAILKVF